MSDMLKALLAYDPCAKLITAVTALDKGVYRVSYIDTARKAFEFTYRSDDDA
jgi:hypothetical protein